jgi:hypothetical protein
VSKLGNAVDANVGQVSNLPVSQKTQIWQVHRDKPGRLETSPTAFVHRHSLPPTSGEVRGLTIRSGGVTISAYREIGWKTDRDKEDGGWFAGRSEFGQSGGCDEHSQCTLSGAV